MPPAYGCTTRPPAPRSAFWATCEGAWSDIGELANLNGLLTGVDTREDHSATNS